MRRDFLVLAVGSTYLRPQAEATSGEAARLNRETCLGETENRARKVSGQGKMLCFSTIFAETICTKQSISTWQPSRHVT